MTPRILFVISRLDTSGSARQLAHLAPELVRRGFDVQVAALRSMEAVESELAALGAPLTIIGQKRSFDPVAIRRLRQLVRRLQPALVQTWDKVSMGYGLITAGNGRLIAYQRSIDRDTSSYSRLLNCLMSRFTARIVVPSRSVREHLLAHGTPPDKLIHIPDGVPAAAPSSVSRSDVLTVLDLPPNSRIIGTVGPLVQSRRMKDLIWATDMLMMLRGNVHLLIFGEGPHLWRLERFCRQCEDEEVVHFLGHRADLADLLPYLEVFCSAANDDGPSHAMLQAMVAGVPIVATSTPSHKELLEDGRQGFLVPLGDRFALARMTNNILNDGELAGHLSLAGKERAAQQFDTNQMASNYEQLYREVLDDQNRARTTWHRRAAL